MVKYAVFEHNVIIDGIKHLTYGIKAEEILGGEAHTVCEVHDVTPSREKAEFICRECNENDLSPVHLRDVCEDFLYAGS